MNVIVFYFILIFSFSAKASEPPFLVHSNEEHEIVFLNTGLSSLQKRLNLINSAQHSIEVEYFIFDNDSSGRILTQALARKAREGLRVRLLVDTINVENSITPFYAHFLERSGVEVLYYNTTPLLNAYLAQYRNHRKSITVDDHYAIIGGRNIEDKYFDLDPSYNFVDRDILVIGPIVESIRESFDAYWFSPFAQKLEVPSRPDRNDLRYRRGSRSQRHIQEANFRRDSQYWHDRMLEARDFLIENDQDRSLLRFISNFTDSEILDLDRGTCSDLTFVSDRPGIGIEAMRWENRKTSRLVYDFIKKAKNEVLLETPYFILGPTSSRLLEITLNRGVEFNLLTNSLHASDLVYVSAAFFGKIRPWIDRGLNPFIYRGDVADGHNIPDVSVSSRWGIHSKSMVIDDEIMMVGSFNFDPRSKIWNSEMAIFCRDAHVSSLLKKSILKRKQGSIYLDSRETVNQYETYRTDFLRTFAYYLLYIPSNVFDFFL